MHWSRVNVRKLHTVFVRLPKEKKNLIMPLAQEILQSADFFVFFEYITKKNVH